MEETKWLTKGKIIIFAIILVIIGSVIAFIFIYRNNLKKEYIKFENQLEYAAPNYLLKEKIILDKNEWREIDIKDIIKQKLIINKRSSDCSGYVIASSNESKNSSNDNVTYDAYIKCKKIYTTPGYGIKPDSENKNNDTTQTQKDTEKPTIELFGDETINLYVGEEYEELGAIAMDNIDGDITSNIKITGSVDTDVEGTYTITYTVSDSAKNKATKKRTIIVTENFDEDFDDDQMQEEPIDDEDYYEDNDDFFDEDFDDDNNSYYENDNQQNNSSDRIAPIITFNNAGALQTICTGERVNTSVNGPYGYVARDNVDGIITNRVKITGSTGIIGSAGVYNLYYTVYDNAGNKATATKQFRVKECGIPVQSLSVTPNNKTISVNQTQQLTVIVNPSNATDKNVTFESLNTSVASVTSKGLVKGVGKGTARIKITSSNGKSVVATITVK